MNIEEINLTVDKGSNYSSFLLAWIKVNGVFVDKDVDSAIKLYRNLSKLGVVEAMHELGELLLSLEVGEEANIEAVSWFTKASQFDFVPSQYFLGYCYETGIGGIQNFEKAASWYEKAAMAGHINASVNLANLCSQRVVKNISENSPLYWYLRVAEVSGSAAYALGGIYEEGIATEKDNELAFCFYVKASKLGNYFASSYLEMIFEMGLLDKNIDKKLALKYATIAESQLKNLEK